MGRAAETVTSAELRKARIHALLTARHAFDGSQCKLNKVQARQRLQRVLSWFTKMTGSYDKERDVAISAVLKASLIAQKVQRTLVQSSGLAKSDKSPVTGKHFALSLEWCVLSQRCTVGDYTAQAIVSALVREHLPKDEIVGEEESTELRKEANKSMKDKIIALANEAMSERLGNDQDEQWWAPVKQQDHSEQDWLALIDQGNSAGGATGRHWALDPIDGTKGFLRQGQYAVCLGLIENGKVVVGVIGCPNLPVDPAKSDDSAAKGVLFVAVKGQGAFSRSFDSSDTKLSPIKMSDISEQTLAEASFCESVESGHSDQKTNKRIADLLGITKPSVRMDSQAKYCSIARGDGDIYLRLPVSDTYEEKIWDHCAGSLIVEEAGGRVSDMNGKPLDFSIGRTLKANKGVVASHANIHSRVIEAVQQAAKESHNDVIH